MSEGPIAALRIRHQKLKNSWIRYHFSLRKKMLIDFVFILNSSSIKIKKKNESQIFRIQALFTEAKF